MREIYCFRLYWSFLLICLSFITLEAQQVVLPAEDLTVADNLTAQTYNYFIYKDSEGFVWISSINGLNRYDGQEVVQYMPNDSIPNAISDVTISGDFCEDKYSNIWFGSDRAIHCYDRLNDRFEKYKIKRNGVWLKAYRVLFVDQKKEEILVAASEGGLLNKIYRFSVDKPDTFTYVYEYFMSIGTEVVEVSELNSKIIYCPLTGRFDTGIGKIIIKDVNADVQVTVDTLLQGIRIEDVFYEDDEHIWCVGLDGVYRTNVKGETLGVTKTFKGTRLKTILSVSSFDENQLLIGTRNEGLFIAEKEPLQIVDQVFYSKEGKVQRFNSLV